MSEEDSGVEGASVARSTIVLVATVTCARCAAWLRYKNVSRGLIAHDLRRRGWSDTRRQGWVCAECLRVERDLRQARASHG